MFLKAVRNTPGLGGQRRQSKLAADRLLGAENAGFVMLMQQLPQQRLSIAVQSQASAQRAFDEAVKFTSDRKAFGKRVLDFEYPLHDIARL